MAKCPYCQNELKSGFIEADGRAAIVWRDENATKNTLQKIASIFATHIGEYIVLGEARIFRNTRVEAEYCDICKKVTIDVL